MKKFVALLLITISLAGCGEVVVFGHVVREGDKTSEAKPGATAPASTSPATSPSTTASSVPQTTATPSAQSTDHPATTPAASATNNTVIATSSDTAADASVNAPVVRHVNAVTLTIAPEVTKEIASEPRFDSKALLEAIKAELQTRKLLEAGHATTGTTLEVYIDHYELHPNTNFVIFGATPNTGKLAGNLALRDEQDNVTTIAHIEAYSHISVPQEGEDRQLLQPLYHEFAVTTADTLAGTHSTSSDVRDQPPR